MPWYWQQSSTLKAKREMDMTDGLFVCKYECILILATHTCISQLPYYQTNYHRKRNVQSTQTRTIPHHGWMCLETKNNKGWVSCCCWDRETRSINQLKLCLLFSIYKNRYIIIFLLLLLRSSDKIDVIKEQYRQKRQTLADRHHMQNWENCRLLQSVRVAKASHRGGWIS